MRLAVNSVVAAKELMSTSIYETIGPFEVRDQHEPFVILEIRRTLERFEVWGEIEGKSSNIILEHIEMMS